MNVLKEELKEIEYLIKITDYDIQVGIVENQNFQETQLGKKLLKDMNRYLSIQNQLVEEISTSDDDDAKMRHGSRF